MLLKNKSTQSISSPEQLSDYLRVTNPGVWIVLAAIMALVVGIIVWASVGTIETHTEAKAIVDNGKAMLIITEGGQGEIKTGMPVHVAGGDYMISSVETDAYGRDIAYAEIPIPTGTYDAQIVTEQLHPISFLYERR